MCHLSSMESGGKKAETGWDARWMMVEEWLMEHDAVLVAGGGVIGRRNAFGRRWRGESGYEKMC